MSTSPLSIIMPQGNDPESAPTPSVLLPPNLHSELPSEPHFIPAELTPEEFNASKARAEHELACIEHQARLLSRTHYPLVPLPRAQSNKLSVKRTRFVRKEVERVVTEKIREKHQRSRELDRLLDIERRKHLHFRKQLEELHKVPDIQQELVRIEHETPEHLGQEFLAGIGAEHDENPNTTVPPLHLPEQDDEFKAEYGNLANRFYDFEPFNDDLPDSESTLHPRILLDPLSDPPEEPECNFLLEPNEGQSGNHHPVVHNVANQDHEDDAPENYQYPDLF